MKLNYRRWRQALKRAAVHDHVKIPPGFKVDSPAPPGRVARLLIERVKNREHLPGLYGFDAPARKAWHKYLPAAIRPKLRVAALKLAAKEFGVRESPPDSNRGPRVEYYERTCAGGSTRLYGQPWCACFAYTMSVLAGRVFSTGINYAYTPAIFAAARRGEDGLRVVSKAAVLPGHWVEYDWNGDGTTDHIGFFEQWIEAGYSFSAIEGNTSFGSDSNGGEVMRRTRYVSQVLGFVDWTNGK